MLRTLRTVWVHATYVRNVAALLKFEKFFRKQLKTEKNKNKSKYPGNTTSTNDVLENFIYGSFLPRKNSNDLNS